jgi:hypothetical protein
MGLIVTTTEFDEYSDDRPKICVNCIHADKDEKDPECILCNMHYMRFLKKCVCGSFHYKTQWGQSSDNDSVSSIGLFPPLGNDDEE